MIPRRLALVAIVGLLATAACRRHEEYDLSLITGGEPRAGKVAIRQYGCGTCHEIAGVTGATGQIGPPLAGIVHRAYIAGVLPNTPENLERWIVDPPAVDSKTAMPRTGVTPDAARDIAAYLYTLR